MKKDKKDKGIKTLILLALVVFVILYFKSSISVFLGRIKISNTDFLNNDEIVSNQSTDTSNWQIYKNRFLSFKYPNEWKVWSDDGNFNMVIGPSDQIVSLPQSTDEREVIYLMMSGPGQTNLPTTEIEKSGKFDVEESKSKINGQEINTRRITKSSDTSFYESEVEVYNSGGQYNAVFTVRNESLVKQMNQILSTFKFNY